MKTLSILGQVTEILRRKQYELMDKKDTIINQIMEGDIESNHGWNLVEDIEERINKITPAISRNLNTLETKEYI